MIKYMEPFFTSLVKIAKHNNIQMTLFYLGRDKPLAVLPALGSLVERVVKLEARVLGGLRQGAKRTSPYFVFAMGVDMVQVMLG